MTMIKIEYIGANDQIEQKLIEVKLKDSQYEMYIDGQLYGSSGSYETCRGEIGEYARSLVLHYFDKEM